ncbi:16S rRNA (adenine(1518)-N(6)/adenine(1519)-N(6))-dimethyltransferase [Patescibacteria group bacterium]|nr:16S rRNA (adenine(1518)-N(6)/adenine(1519)-N(6))-dimethyltransferase [Patescibacteria group bacterium]
MSLSTNSPKSILSRYGLLPHKQLGQNFLVNQHILSDLLETADLTPKNVILEIGAGSGAITVELARRAKKVIAVEIDKKLIPILNNAIRDAGMLDKVQIINADILKLRITNDESGIMDNKVNGVNRVNEASEANEPKKLEKFTPYRLEKSGSGLKILGAIPYQITSPLLHKLLKLEIPPQLIVLIIQNEVAEKIAAQPPQATYLGNFVQSLAKIELVGRPIHPAAFWPQPKVQSRIIKIRPKDPVFTGIENIYRWEKFLHRAFSHPRKMLRNVFPTELLEKSGIEPTARPQEINLEQWKTLAKSLTSKSN